jgi:hypothetical protein
MSQRLSGYQRQPDDVYETPTWVTQLVVGYLQQQGCRHVWDPANGPDSKLAQTLRDDGFRVTATNSNFFAMRARPHNDIDTICTNPPYGRGGRLASQFIEHALELAPNVLMLLRNDFDSGRTRTHLFRDQRTFKHKLPLLHRIKWFDGPKEPSDNHAWFIWDSNYYGLATIVYVRRP